MTTWFILAAVIGLALAMRPTGFADAPAPATATSPAAGQGAAAPAQPTQGQQTPPDPYAGLTPEDRQAVEYFDGIVKPLSPQERIELIRYAQKGLDVSKQEAARLAAKAADPPKPQSVEDPRDARLSAMEAELKRMREKEAAQERALKAKADAEQFYGTIGGILGAKDSGVSKDEEAKDEIAEAVLGALVRHKEKWGDTRPFNTAEVTREKLARFKKRASAAEVESRVEWLDAKRRDAEETVGETATGAAPAKDVPKISGEDFLQGAVGERLAKELRGH